MNRPWILAAALALVASPVLAQQGYNAHHPVQQKQGAAGRKASEANFKQHMQKMQALMDKMRATQDPQQRQQLMQEHVRLMQEGMQMQHTAMANCPMLGEGGMEMMQMMMDHMQQREGMMGQGMGGGMQDRSMGPGSRGQ